MRFILQVTYLTHSFIPNKVMTFWSGVVNTFHTNASTTSSHVFTFSTSQETFSVLIQVFLFLFYFIICVKFFECHNLIMSNSYPFNALVLISILVHLTFLMTVLFVIYLKYFVHVVLVLKLLPVPSPQWIFNHQKQKKCHKVALTSHNTSAGCLTLRLAQWWNWLTDWI